MQMFLCVPELACFVMLIWEEEEEEGEVFKERWDQTLVFRGNMTVSLGWSGIVLVLQKEK